MFTLRASSPTARRRTIGGLLLACALGASSHQTGAEESQKTALVLHAVRQEGEATITIDRVLRRVLTNALKGRLDYYAEYLDFARFPDPNYKATLGEFLNHKYAQQSFDVVLATSPDVLDFVEAHGGELLSGTPVVFYASTTPRPAPMATGVVAEFDLRGTLDVAIQLHPDLQHVYVLSGASAFDKSYEDSAREQFRAFEGRLAFTYLSGLSMPELLQRTSALPPRSIIYFLTVQEDGDGQRFVGPQSLEQIAAVANRPIYAWIDVGLGRGVVGGNLLSMEALAGALADVALRVLTGESPASIPVRKIDVNVIAVDWRELQRWGISEASLPAGSIVQFRQPSVWHQYKSYIVGATVVFGLQSALIAGMVVQRARRRRVERALRESESHFRVMADTAPVLIWRSGADKAFDFFNKPWLDFRGRTLEQERGSGWTDGVHPDDIESCLRVHGDACDAREPFNVEYRLLRGDGEYRWVLDTGVPRYDERGEFAGYIGSALDITWRKQIEQSFRDGENALRQSYEQNRDLAGRLINAQEAERTRIARDLHDDLSQQLAGVAIMLSGLKRKAGKPGSEADIELTITTLQDRTSALAQAIRNLSHELHPSVLEHMGLVATLRRHCADVEDHHQLTVRFSAGAHVDSLPPEVALCLFRVAQGALTNAVRHARARTVLVQLMAENDVVELRVIDDGIGFDTAKRHRGGLGLRSIDERVRYFRGRLSIESQPDRGTTLSVRIPARGELGATPETASSAAQAEMTA